MTGRRSMMSLPPASFILDAGEGRCLMADTISEITDEVKEKAKESVKDTLKEETKEPVGPEVWSRLQSPTLEDIDYRLRQELEARIRYFAERPAEIDRRLSELDHEWDMERLLMASAGSLSLTGLVFGIVHRRWYLLPAAMGVFLIQHAAKGWCPPSSLLRRLSIRTSAEVNHERYALKAVRGDFDDVRAEESPEERTRRAIEAADKNA